MLIFFISNTHTFNKKGVFANHSAKISQKYYVIVSQYDMGAKVIESFQTIVLKLHFTRVAIKTMIPKMMIV